MTSRRFWHGLGHEVAVEWPVFAMCNSGALMEYENGGPKMHLCLRSTVE